MGYTTDFFGAFAVTPPLLSKHRLYLKAFNDTRRMKRDATKAEKLDDPVRKRAGLPIGADGGYFVGGGGFMGQEEDKSVMNFNAPPSGQPGLWCQWVSNDKGTKIEWDGGEKFYDYVEWLVYLIEHFLSRWGYSLNGEVEWQGEDNDDRGKIVVKDNLVRTFHAVITYEEN